MDAEVEKLNDEEEYYSIAREWISNSIRPYIFNKNKKFKENNNYIVPVEEFICQAMDMSEATMFYCLSYAQLATEDSIFEFDKDKKLEKKAQKELKTIFKDFKISQDGHSYTCSTKFNWD